MNRIVFDFRKIECITSGIQSGYYLLTMFSERVMKQAVPIDRKHLVSIGTCFGKFSKTGKFKLHITCLDFLSQYAEVNTLQFLCLIIGSTKYG